MKNISSLGFALCTIRTEDGTDRYVDINTASEEEMNSLISQSSGNSPIKINVWLTKEESLRFVKNLFA